MSNNPVIDPHPSAFYYHDQFPFTLPPKDIRSRRPGDLPGRRCWVFSSARNEYYLLPQINAYTISPNTRIPPIQFIQQPIDCHQIWGTPKATPGVRSGGGFEPHLNGFYDQREARREGSNLSRTPRAMP